MMPPSKISKKSTNWKKDEPIILLCFCCCNIKTNKNKKKCEMKNAEYGIKLKMGNAECKTESGF
jgi:hypothetical protein